MPSPQKACQGRPGLKGICNLVLDPGGMIGVLSYFPDTEQHEVTMAIDPTQPVERVPATWHSFHAGKDFS
jgi:hypothetical protein